jgi:hypothetical protein
VNRYLVGENLLRYGQPVQSPDGYLPGDTHLSQNGTYPCRICGKHMMVTSPQVSWLFFKARAKRPYSESYGSSEQRGKTANWPRAGGLR